jgi:hypothetical protein
MRLAFFPLVLVLAAAACGAVDGTVLGDPCTMCSANATCDPVQEDPCTCKPGWQGNGRSCQDVDECATDNGGCGENGYCVNEPGTFTCDCHSGYAWDGETCASVWTKVATVPDRELGDFYQTVGMGSRIYFARESVSAPEFHSFDLATGTARDETTPPVNVLCACGATTRLVASGGRLHYFSNNLAYAYDPSAKEWTELLNPSDYWRASQADAPLDGRIFQIGGSGPLSSVQSYDTSLQAYSTDHTSAPYTVWGGLAVPLDGRIYLLGGNTSVDSNHRMAMYDPVGDTWAVLPNMPIGLYESSSYGGYAVGLRGRIHAANGYTMRTWDSATGDWSDDIGFPKDHAKWTLVVAHGDLHAVAEDAAGLHVFRYAP